MDDDGAATMTRHSGQGRLAEWSKAGAMLNDVNHDGGVQLLHRGFESLTFHTKQYAPAG